MNCKKYRAYLIGLVAAALVCGVLIYVVQGRQDKIPAEGTLVEREMEAEDGINV